MIYFTKYAEQKFDILNAHKVYIRKEEIESILKAPEKSGKISKLFTAQSADIKVVYQKEGSIKKVITFYPI
jgi:DNA-directed RNA polymerase subunit F